MAETPKTAAPKSSKSNVLVGLIIGLVIAALAAVVAFGFMSKNNSPVQTDDFLNEQNQDRDRLNRGFDPNDSLQSKVPLKSFANKAGGSNNSSGNADSNSDTNNSNNANADNSDNSDNASNTTEASNDSSSGLEKAKNKIVEVFDEFGDKKLAVKKEMPAEEIDPDAIAMRESKEQKDAQKVADEAAQQKKLQQQKAKEERAKEAKIRELEKQDRAERRQKETPSQADKNDLNDPIDAIVNNTSNTSTSTAATARAKKVEPKEDNKSNDTFYVQTGAFKNITQADQQRAMLLMQGVQARVSEVDSNGQTLHRVRLGPFNSRQDVQKIERTLEQNNLSYKVIKVAE